MQDTHQMSADQIFSSLNIIQQKTINSEVDQSEKLGNKQDFDA